LVAALSKKEGKAFRVLFFEEESNPKNLPLSFLGVLLIY
jgi:hypothetical protein